MQRGHNAIVNQQFGGQAQAYVSSATHASGPDLKRLAEVAQGWPGATVLDLGCGGGHVSYTIAPHAEKVVASDLSQPMLDAVMTEAGRRGIANIETTQAAAEALPFADGEFDAVICRMSAHHWQDFDAGLREARRVVKKGSPAIFIDVVSPDSPMLDTHLQAVELLRDRSHVRDYRITEWSAALGRAGFDLTRVFTHTLPMEFASWVKRMRTPDDLVAAIRSLQTEASEEVRKAFAIQEDGSFSIRIATFELTAS
ncbi:class I SAM-dependent methyltransferase [Novosphingobium sp. P6W]|uniref:class I SAM-dependent methyltransferase n=1 Tax=Novosphingobium sp. P6W TaxID=1609758 RepID=UPI0005C31AAF|nr:class I SAM-dependent methyltransferase [Novosphingobium sp. P6W]AXB78615.1 class I SAM-dependent methyltransferase [Novosphingobium sp. P6W]KIS29415.1 SAM-dependent methyltransferase [Novosphingobium sp. P6W]